MQKHFGRIAAESGVRPEHGNDDASVQAALRRALALRAIGRARFAVLRRALQERLEAVLRDGFAFFFAIFAISLSLSFLGFSSAQNIRIATTCFVRLCDKP